MASVKTRGALTMACVLPRKSLYASERRMAWLRRRQSQRKAVLVVMMTSLLLQMVRVRMPRTVWSYEKSAHWWDHIVLQTFTDSDWLENVCVSRATFLYLCSEREPGIAKKRTRFRTPISVKKRVVITLWVLATTVEYRTIAHLFGVAAVLYAVLCRRLASH